MASDSISLIAGMRENLQSLQRTSALQEVSSRNLATGRKVNSPIDDPLRYFQARALSNRATDLAGIKDQVNQAVSAISAASEGGRAIGALLGQMKGVAQAARDSLDPEVRANFAAQFNVLRGQIDGIARDSGYNGTNLLRSGELRVGFENGALTVASADASADGLGVAAAAQDGTGFTSSDLAVSNAAIDAALSQVQAATTELRDLSSRLGSSLGTLTVRSDHTKAVADTLRTGADDLTLADPNEEAVALIALRTRQQLGQTALSIANASQRSLLALF